MWFQILLIFLAIYLWYQKRFTFWYKHGFPYIPGKFPLGSAPKVGISEPVTDFFDKVCLEFRDKGPAFGMYMMASPVLIPTDPELVKAIYVRNFDTFHDRGFHISEEVDPLSQNLSMIGGQAWKDLRAKLSPTFTSGKMKMMFPNIVRNADRMIDYLTPFAERIEPLEMKEVYSSFTTEVIADVAFGLEINCLGNPDNEFRKIAKRMVEPTIWENLRFGVVMSFEKISKVLGFGFNSRDVVDFFMKVVSETVNYRDRNKTERNDFLQLLLNIRDSKEGMSFNQIAANSFVFFFAGFETSSSVMTFSTYELALNQDIQDKLRKEINDVLMQHNGELTYEGILQMKYLDMVFNESLRRYPVVDLQSRQAVKDFAIPNTNLVIPSGTMIMIPASALHNDTRFWVNPSKFDPERFTPENVQKQVPFAYVPFGEGPRQCIGMRFGQLQTKIGLVKLLMNFRMLPCSKTVIPMKFIPNAMFQSPLGGMWLKLERIST